MVQGVEAKLGRPVPNDPLTLNEFRLRIRDSGHAEEAWEAGRQAGGEGGAIRWQI